MSSLVIPDIRPTTLQDVPAMDQLLQGLAEFLNEPEAYCRNLDALRHYGFGARKIFHSLIACHDQTPVGLSIFFPEFSTWWGQSGVYIQDLYVTSSCRGTGLGRSLMAATLEYAEENWDGKYIRLSADHQNHNAIGFYRQLGFRVDKENLILKMTSEAIEHSEFKLSPPV